MVNKKNAQNLSMAFESRDAERRQGIFGATEQLEEVWSKIAKNFTVSLPIPLLGRGEVAGFRWTRHDWP